MSQPKRTDITIKIIDVPGGESQVNVAGAAGVFDAKGTPTQVEINVPQLMAAAIRGAAFMVREMQPAEMGSTVGPAQLAGILLNAAVMVSELRPKSEVPALMIARDGQIPRLPN